MSFKMAAKEDVHLQKHDHLFLPEYIVKNSGFSFDIGMYNFEVTLAVKFQEKTLT